MFLDILKDISSRKGLDLDDQGEKDTCITYANQAIKETYESVDLPESLDEDIFDINVDSQLVTLPWFCEYIRGWRYYDSRRPIQQEAKNNRYGQDFSNEIWNYNYRDVQRSCISREIINESRLRLYIPIAETAAFSVRIVGATSNSAKIEEVIDFAIGETEKESTNTFKEPITSITKSGVTTYNLTVKDVLGNTLSVIPNFKTAVNYRIIQIYDTENATQIQQSAVEILFKGPAPKLVHDGDQFLMTDRYDKAVFFKYCELNTKDIKEAAAFQFKFNQEVNRLVGDANMGKHRKMSFVPRISELRYRYVYGTIRSPYRI